MTELYWWILAGSVFFYIVMTFSYACHSENNNNYYNFGLDMFWGLMWPITLAKWLYRLPGEIKNNSNSGAARVIRDVWNG